MHGHPHHDHSRTPNAAGEGQTRWPLPLGEHPHLEVSSDFAIVGVIGAPDGEEPYLELLQPGDRHFGHHHHPLRHIHPATAAPAVQVTAEGGVTRVRIDGGARTDIDRGGPWRRPSFWEAASREHIGHLRKWSGRHLRTEVVLHVPKDVKARIRAVAVRLQVSGLVACDLHVDVDAGSIALDDVAGRIDLTAQAGRVEGTGLRGAIAVVTNAGTVRLEILALDPGTHRIRTNMGATAIELAQGMPVQIDTRTAMGSSRVDAESTRGAPSILDVEADLGAIRVMSSRRRIWQSGPASAPAPVVTPYRTAAPREESPPVDDAEVEKILAKVADGSLTPPDARELLRALGWR